MAIYTGFASAPQFAQSVTLNPSAVPALSVATETFTVKGLKTSMIPAVNAASLDAGLILISARITAADTLELTFQNTTASSINPASQSFNVIGL